MTNRIIIWVVLIAFTAGCTTTQPVSANPTAIQTHVQAGDKLKVHLNDETFSTLKMKVTGITDEGLQGRDNFIQYSDIEFIEIKHVSAVKTVLLIGGLLLVVATINAAGHAALIDEGFCAP